MKITEIMINDWYKWYADGREYFFKVDRESFALQDDTLANFESITLTAEILEKNGFRKLDFSHYQIQDRTLVLDADGKWGGPLCWHWVVTEMSENSKGQNVVLDYYVATINYVHELQHALRLCGLNELADSIII